MMSSSPPQKNEASPPRGRLKRIGRVLFRFFRTALLVFLLVTVVLGLFLNNLTGQLAFQEDGLWELRSLRGHFHAVKFEVSGSLGHALMIRQLKIPQGEQKAPASAETFLHQIEVVWSQLKLSGQSELRLRFHGDAKDISTLSANLYGSLP